MLARHGAEEVELFNLLGGFELGVLSRVLATHAERQTCRGAVISYARSRQLALSLSGKT